MKVNVFKQFNSRIPGQQPVEVSFKADKQQSQKQGGTVQKQNEELNIK